MDCIPTVAEWKVEAGGKDMRHLFDTQTRGFQLCNQHKILRTKKKGTEDWHRHTKSFSSTVTLFHCRPAKHCPRNHVQEWPKITWLKTWLHVNCMPKYPPQHFPKIRLLRTTCEKGRLSRVLDAYVYRNYTVWANKQASRALTIHKHGNITCSVGDPRHRYRTNDRLLAR